MRQVECVMMRLLQLRVFLSCVGLASGCKEEELEESCKTIVKETICVILSIVNYPLDVC